MLTLHDHKKIQEIYKNVHPGEWYVIYENLALPSEKPAWVWKLCKEELTYGKQNAVVSIVYVIDSPEDYDTKEECLEEVRRIAKEFNHEIVYELKYY